MYNLRRFYNQNRKAIWRIILIIAFAIIILQVLNGFAKNRNNEKITELNTNNVNKNATTLNGVISKKSSITGETIDNNKLKADSDIIDEFILNCNNKDINKAYDLLSNDCKNEVFPTIDDFNRIYYQEVFKNGEIIHTIENWNDNIYKVNMNENMLSTGIVNDDNQKQDYITIVKENGEKKLNINGFIEKRAINKQKENNGIIVKVLDENVYIDYITYNFEITNTTSLDIMMDSLNGSNTMYIEDNNDMKHLAYVQELSSGELFVGSKSSTKVKVKYYSKYNSTRIIDKIYFSKIIENYRGNVEFYSKIMVEI